MSDGMTLAAPRRAIAWRRDRNCGQYVLTYENSAVKAAAKKKLFVVITTNGKLVSAGHKAS